MIFKNSLIISFIFLLTISGVEAQTEQSTSTEKESSGTVEQTDRKKSIQRVAQAAKRSAVQQTIQVRRLTNRNLDRTKLKMMAMQQRHSRKVRNLSRKMNPSRWRMHHAC